MSTKDYLDKDLYSVLGVPKGAPAADVKKAYRKLARELHPDTNKNNPDAEARFKDVSEAYHILGDEARREVLDGQRVRRRILLFAVESDFTLPPIGLELEELQFIGNQLFRLDDKRWASKWSFHR